MKKIVLLFILSSCVVYSQTYYMNVRTKGGGTTSFALSDIQKIRITFSSDAVYEGEIRISSKRLHCYRTILIRSIRQLQSNMSFPKQDWSMLMFMTSTVDLYGRCWTNIRRLEYTNYDGTAKTTLVHQ